MRHYTGYGSWRMNASLPLYLGKDRQTSAIRSGQKSFLSSI